MNKKILHIVSGNSEGGAALGARELHDELIRSGNKSLILFDKVFTNGEGYIALDINGRIKLFINRCLFRLLEVINPNSLDVFNRITGLSVYKSKILKIKPDIIHLHWLSRFGNLNQFEGSHKVVITARDLWWGTGGCHYTLKCKGYMSDCSKCNYFKFPKNFIEYKKEKEKFNKKFKIYAISTWLKNTLQDGGLKNISYIPNSVYNGTLEVIEPRNKPNGKFLFIPAGHLASKYKGITLLFTLIKQNQDVNFIFAGNGLLPSEISMLANVKSIGFLPRANLNWYYSEADLVLIPSTQEAFGKTVVEALINNAITVVMKGSAPEEIIRKVCININDYIFLDDVLKSKKKISNHNFKKLIIDDEALKRYSSKNVALEYMKVYYE